MRKPATRGKSKHDTPRGKITPAIVASPEFKAAIAYHNSLDINADRLRPKRYSWQTEDTE